MAIKYQCRSNNYIRQSLSSSSESLKVSDILKPETRSKTTYCWSHEPIERLRKITVRGAAEDFATFDSWPEEVQGHMADHVPQQPAQGHHGNGDASASMRGKVDVWLKLHLTLGAQRC